MQLLKNKTLWIFVGVAVAALLYWKFPKGESEADKPKAAPAMAKGAFIKVYVAKNSLLEDKLTTKGSIMANEEVAISSEINGKITAIHFREGEHVSKGKLLVSINDSDLQAQLQKVTFEHEFLEKKLARETQLAAKGGVSQEQVETTMKDKDAKKAEIALVQAQLAKTKIYAPFSGMIGLREVSEGGYLTAGRSIATLISVSPLKVSFSIPEKYMAIVKVGDILYYSVEGIDGQFKASIYAIDHKIDPATRSIQMRAIAIQADSRILPGAFAKVDLIFNRIANALLIPTEAIIPEMSTKKVFIVQQGKAVERQVQTGIRSSAHIQIKEGISAGDSVVVSGMLQLQNGTPVSITAVVAD